MTKRQDLCLQQRSRPEQSDQREPNQAANIFHQPRASPDSTSLASWIEFPTMTGGEIERERQAINSILHEFADAAFFDFSNHALNRLLKPSTIALNRPTTK